MAKQRSVVTKFWDDTYIMKLDPIEKLLFLYLLTNPLTNICGIYEITPRRVAFDTGIDSEMVEKIFKRYEKEQKIVYQNGWVCIVNFIKNQTLNPSVVKGIKRELKLVPRDSLLQLATVCHSLNQDGSLNLTKLNLTKPNAVATASKNFSHNGQVMIKDYGKWYKIENGNKVLFTGRESEIVEIK